MAEALRIGLLAGEASGDALGATLLCALRRRSPKTRCIGIGGPRMRAAGLEALGELSLPAVNGFLAPLLRAPELLRTLHGARRALLDAQLDAFVGIDFNVFNLRVEQFLRRRGVAVAHYVSPTVWAWRAQRVHEVARAADRLLALYPFEAAHYRGTALDVRFVGHPLADELSPAPKVSSQCLTLALLPGSRVGELARHAPLFVAAARRFAAAQGAVRCVAAVLDGAAERALRRSADAQGLPLEIIIGAAPDALRSADLALVKSGTVTLEAMLMGVPMVVAYRLDPFSHALVRRRLRTPWVALPNILAETALVPELLQDAATPEALAAALARVAAEPKAQTTRFSALAETLAGDAAGRAADAVLELAGRAA